MVLQVELANPGGQARIVPDSCVESFEEAVDTPGLQLRETRQLAEHASGFEHLLGRAAAAVTPSIAVEQLVVDRLLAIVIPEPEGLATAHIAHVGIELSIGEMLHRLGRGGDKVGQHFAAVDPAPAEGVVGHAVKLVPTDLRRHEAVDPTPAHQLGQGRAVAKHVGQPDDMVALAELFSEEAGAVDQLTYQRLATSDVTVRLQPHHAHRFKAPLGNSCLHPYVERRIILLEVGVDLGLRHAEVVLGVALHQVQGIGDGVRYLLAGPPEGPEPCHIEVGVASSNDHRGGIAYRPAR